MTSETLRSHETTQRLMESYEVRWPSASTVHAAIMTLPGPGHGRRLWTGDATGAALLGESRFGVFHRVSSGAGLGALLQVMSMHRLDGQCCPVGRGMELFRWRGGFRDEYVPTIPQARRCPASCIRLWPGHRVGAPPCRTRPWRPPELSWRQRACGSGLAGGRAGAVERTGAIRVQEAAWGPFRESEGCGRAGGGVCAGAGGGGLLGEGCQG